MNFVIILTRASHVKL